MNPLELTQKLSLPPLIPPTSEGNFAPSPLSPYGDKGEGLGEVFA